MTTDMIHVRSFNHMFQADPKTKKAAKHKSLEEQAKTKYMVVYDPTDQYDKGAFFSRYQFETGLLYKTCWPLGMQVRHPEKGVGTIKMVLIESKIKGKFIEGMRLVAADGKILPIHEKWGRGSY